MPADLSGNNFALDRPARSNNLFSGPNTGGGPFGGDFDTYGKIFGEGEFGGYVHFRNRSDLPIVSHS